MESSDVCAKAALTYSTAVQHRKIFNFKILFSIYHGIVADFHYSYIFCCILIFPVYIYLLMKVMIEAGVCVG